MQRTASLRLKSDFESTDKVRKPRYLSVAATLEESIGKGRFQVGETLPTEHELCRLFGVSRPTVREALRQLSEAGMLARRPRVGTIVLAPRRARPYIHSLGSLDDIQQYATDTEMRIVYLGKIVVDESLAKEIPMGIGEKWLLGIGIRHANNSDVPVCVARFYVNPDFEGIAQRIQARTGAIYKIIEKHYKTKVARVQQTISAVALPKDDALYLKAKAKSPTLRVLRLYYDKNGRLLEASDSIHPGDRFSYAMTMSQSA